ncbi:MAG: phosphatase PAP2 family protein [Polyangiaceae bacterium]
MDIRKAQAALAGERHLGVQAMTASFVQELASQDWLLLGYLVAIFLALAFGSGPHREPCMIHIATDLGAFVFVLALVRLQVLRAGGAAASLLYRVSVMATLLVTFFQLREILPAVSSRALDSSIYAADLRVFGVEPSVWLDRFVCTGATEWFAFFYFLYFLILTVHVLPMLFFWRGHDRELARFGVGFLLIFLSAHLLYMVVPGWGPYAYLKDSFHHQLRGPFFWPLVRETVDAGGAQKDIFPSLHTAVPTYIAIFSYQHRKLKPFKYTWWIMAFLATQIILATMFLRWHYLIDVVAGLTLACTAAFAGKKIADWEHIRRGRLGLSPGWMPLVFPWS